MTCLAACCRAGRSSAPRIKPADALRATRRPGGWETGPWALIFVARLWPAAGRELSPSVHVFGPWARPQASEQPDEAPCLPTARIYEIGLFLAGPSVEGVTLRPRTWKDPDVKHRDHHWHTGEPIYGQRPARVAVQRRRREQLPPRTDRNGHDQRLARGVRHPSNLGIGSYNAATRVYTVVGAATGLLTPNPWQGNKLTTA